MDLLTELSQLNLDPALLARVQQLVDSHAESAVYQAIIAEQSQRLADKDLLLAEQKQHLVDKDRFIAEQEHDLTDKNLLITERDAIIRVRDVTIQQLAFEIAYYRRIRFANKSEHFSPEQRDLFQETWNTDMSAIEAEIEQLSPSCSSKKPRPHAGRPLLPEHLPRIEHRHEPESCSCGQCGQDLVKIGEDISEQLDIEPARFFVHRHIRPQYACRYCETITAAPVEPAIIDGGMAASGLLTWVAIGKFCDHLPLYRLEQIAARQNVPLSRSTLADWVGRIGVALQPLADRLREHLRQRQVLHVDETPVAQLDPGKGKTKRAYLWAYRSNDLDTTGPPLVLFEYHPNRNGEHVRTMLKDWQGHVMVDDYAGYKALFQHGAIIELGCFAHARRKFFDLYATNRSGLADQALSWIGRLYDIEEKGRTLSSEQRLAWRQQEAVPVLEQGYRWLCETQQRAAQGSGLAKAIEYTLKRWPALIRYAQTGNLPIDNNAVENAIRPVALGKKIGSSWDLNGRENGRLLFRAYWVPPN